MKKNRYHHSLSALATALAIVSTAPSLAFEINADYPDWSIRWDNTIRYTLGKRLGTPDSLIVKSTDTRVPTSSTTGAQNRLYRNYGNNAINIDDGNSHFKKNDLTTNRLDVLSEFDAVYQQRVGFRLSAAGWYDEVYSGDLSHFYGTTAKSNHIDAQGNQIDGLSDTAKRYAHTGAEILDAFVFSRFDVAEDTPMTVRFGKHTVFWGETLGINAGLNGIAYSQGSIDLIKGLQIPGIEAKEAFLPREQISAQLSVSPELSFSAQKFFKFQPLRIPGPGTYMSGSDVVGEGAEALLLSTPLIRGGHSNTTLGVVGADRATYVLNRSGDVKPKGSRDWGLAMKWSPEDIGAVGLFYRHYTDVTPMAMVIPGKAVIASVLADNLPQFASSLVTGVYNRYINSSTVTPSGWGQYKLGYNSQANMLGLSYSGNVAGISVGAELSIRRNQMLNSILPLVGDSNAARVARVLSQPTATFDQVNSGNLPVALGETAHFNVNLLGTLSNTGIFDSAVWTVEVAHQRLNKVSKNPQYYKGDVSFTADRATLNSTDATITMTPTTYENARYVGIDKPSKSATFLQLGFTPTWFQVMPSLDLSMPISYGRGIAGNAPTGSFYKGAGTQSIGLTAVYRQQYSFDLRYVDYFGKLQYQDPYQSGGPYVSLVGPTVVSAGGSLRDRDQLMFTFKTTF